jgi:hypothetical protein
MRCIRWLTVLSLSMTTTACAWLPFKTPPDIFDAAIDGLRGRSVKEVLEALGPPTSKKESSDSGRTRYSWLKTMRYEIRYMVSDTTAGGRLSGIKEYRVEKSISYCNFHIVADMSGTIVDGSYNYEAHRGELTVCRPLSIPLYKFQKTK